MPNPHTRMSIIREVLRLKYESRLSHRQIARALKVSIGTVSNYLLLFERCRLEYPLSADLTEAGLQDLLESVKPPPKPSLFAEPDFVEIHRQLKQKGVTRQLLWEEYKTAHPTNHYRYSQFCFYYREWQKHLKVSLRQSYKAGEKMFVDYAGPTLEIIDALTGEYRTAQIFVAVLGASNYTFAEATFSQKLEDWIPSHIRAFEFFGGVPEMVVPDNLKSGVTKACRYEPLLNESYSRMLAHYQTCALPARPYKPQDKAKVEVGVQIVERWILARLRKRTFFSLFELNLAIRELLNELNEKPFKKLVGNRRTAFAELDQPALKPLPRERYEYVEWHKARVHFDCHIEIKRHYYSVPYQFIKQEIEVRMSEKTVECFAKGKRIAVHVRSALIGRYSTQSVHLPKHHQAHLDWTPERLLRWAASIGEQTHKLVKVMLTCKPHAEMAYRSSLGLLNLVKRYSAQRVEAACRVALEIGSPNRRSVASILAQELDKLPLQEELSTPEIPLHENIRGADYYK
jgi:transposase